METHQPTNGTSASGEKNNANKYTDGPLDDVSTWTLLEDLMTRFEMTEQDAMDIISRMRFMFLE